MQNKLIYSSRRIEWQRFATDISIWKNDTLAENRLYDDFKNIIEGLLSRGSRYYPIQYKEEIIQDVCLYTFQKILGKIKDQYKNNEMAVFNFVQKGIQLRLSCSIKDFKRLEKDKTCKLPEEMLICNKPKVEDILIDKQYELYVYGRAIELLKLQFSEDNKAQLILNCIADNNLHYILLKQELFYRDFKISNSYPYRNKLCKAFRFFIKEILKEDHMKEDIFDDVLEEDDNEDFDFDFDDDDEEDEEEERREIEEDEEDEEETKKPFIVEEEDIEVQASDCVGSTKEKNISEVLTSSEICSPDTDGEIAKKILDTMVTDWVNKAHQLGAIINRVHQHFKKERNEFERWLEKHVKMKYPMAMNYKRIGKMKTETIDELLNKGFSSLHTIKLLSLKGEDKQLEFLKEEKHEIDDMGRQVKTEEMTAKDVQDAIKILNKKPDKETSRTEDFMKIMKKLDSSLNKICESWDDDVVYNKDIDISELSEDEIEIAKSALRQLNSSSDDLTNLMKKLFKGK